MTASAVPWVVEGEVDERVTVPGGEAVGRDEFHAWVWDRAVGLLGIDEGAVTVVEAARRGIVAAPMVIDAAAAPPDRDWLAGVAVATVEWWFADEPSARAAVPLLAAVRGCRVGRVRADAAIDHEALARSAFGAIAVPGFGVVRPSWEDGVAGVADDRRAEIFIEPGMGFGTGLHETTQLCLAAVAARWWRGAGLGHVLDFGGGSGILGIAAAVLGAGQVDAVEIDERVHAAVRGNAVRNGVADRVRVSSTIPADAAPYDLVIANIVPTVLIEHAAELCRRTRVGGGEVVLSGLLTDDVPGIVDRFEPLVGSRPLVREQGEWRCLSFRLE